jgi:hypothetical protein
LVAVPLDLILSPGVPGVTQPSTPAETLPLLHSSAVSQAWEMQVAAQLLWALRQPLQSRFGFWQQYRPLLPRSLEDCSSLLVWSAAELSELQVRLCQVLAVNR